MDTRNKQAPAAPRDRRRWEPPRLEMVGTIGEVLQGGGGKLSTIGGDPGDNRKPTGQGPG
jgi:hypothetical protein